MTDTPAKIEYGRLALERLRELAEKKEIDICAYLAKNKIDVDINLRRLYDIMTDTERPEDQKEAAKRLFELDFNPEQAAKWGKQKFFRIGDGTENEKESG